MATHDWAGLGRLAPVQRDDQHRSRVLSSYTSMGDFILHSIFGVKRMQSLPPESKYFWKVRRHRGRAQRRPAGRARLGLPGAAGSVHAVPGAMESERLPLRAGARPAPRLAVGVARGRHRRRGAAGAHPAPLPAGPLRHRLLRQPRAQPIRQGERQRGHTAQHSGAGRGVRCPSLASSSCLSRVVVALMRRRLPHMVVAPVLHVQDVFHAHVFWRP